MANRTTTQTLSEPGLESDSHEPPEFVGEEGDLELPRGHRRVAELVFRLFTEGQSPSRQATAVGIGVLIGCIPIFGFHLPLVLLVATLFRLSRLRMYAATWISNPVFAPFLVWSELQAGNLILTGELMDHSLKSAIESGVVALGKNLAVGSLAVGGVLGFLAALVVWAAIPRGPEEARRRRVIEKTAHRYLGLGMVPWFQVRRSLYKHRGIVDLVSSGRLNPKRTLVDLDCGRGEFLALVMNWSPDGPPVSCIGVTSDPICAAQARRILPSSVMIVDGDAGIRDLGSVDAAVLWNTNNRNRRKISDDLIKTVRASLNRSGSFVICWSKSSGPLTLDQVVQRLEAEGFVVDDIPVQKHCLRRESLILARACEAACDGNRTVD